MKVYARQEHEATPNRSMPVAEIQSPREAEQLVRDLVAMSGVYIAETCNTSIDISHQFVYEEDGELYCELIIA